VAAAIINQGIHDSKLRAPKELPANIYVGGTDTVRSANHIVDLYQAGLHYGI
jgi:hypothetical protein